MWVIIPVVILVLLLVFGLCGAAGMKSPKPGDKRGNSI